MIATDGDCGSVELAKHNININIGANPHRSGDNTDGNPGRGKDSSTCVPILVAQELYWGNQEHIESVQNLVTAIVGGDGDGDGNTNINCNNINHTNTGTSTATANTTNTSTTNTSTYRGVDYIIMSVVSESLVWVMCCYLLLT